MPRSANFGPPLLGESHLSITFFWPLTVPLSSHSREAANISRWFFSHMALWTSRPGSRTPCRRRYRVKIAHILRVHLAIILAGKHQGGDFGVLRHLRRPAGPGAVTGARRAGGSQDAPTGSDASISFQTESKAPCSYCPAQGAWPFHNFTRSAWVWTLNAEPRAGVAAAAGARPDCAVSGRQQH